MPIVRGGYGYDLYSSSDYGTEGAVYDASATIAATSGVTASGGRDITGVAAVSATSSTSSTSAYRIRESGSAVSTTSGVVAAGEGVVIKRSDKLQYGGGAYGYNVYDQADLQTIVVAQSSTASVNGVRIQESGASMSSSSSASADSEQIFQSGSTVSASSSATASAVYTIKVSASLSAESAVTISYIRRRHASSAASVTSGTLAIGREKWEIIPEASDTWTEVSPTSTTWTTIAA